MDLPALKDPLPPLPDPAPADEAQQAMIAAAVQAALSAIHTTHDPSSSGSTPVTMSSSIQAAAVMTTPASKNKTKAKAGKGKIAVQRQGGVIFHSRRRSVC